MALTCVLRDSQFKINLIRSLLKNVLVLFLAGDAICVLLGRILSSPLSMWGNLNLLLTLIQEAAINILSSGLQLCCLEALSEHSLHCPNTSSPETSKTPFTSLPLRFWHAVHKWSMLGVCGR